MRRAGVRTPVSRLAGGLSRVDLGALVEQAKSSDYFSGARLAAELRMFIPSASDALTRLGTEMRGRTDQLYLVGSGGSYANLITARYVLDRFLPLPVEAIPSFDLIWRQPVRLSRNSLVMFASQSGETEDTLEAVRYARSRGATTIAVVGKAECGIGDAADYRVPFGSAACYEAPLVAAIVLGAALVGEPAPRIISELLAGVRGLPEVIDRVMAFEEQRAAAKARAFLGSQHIYVLAAGPLSALGYKLAMSVIMENLRIGATYSDAVEFRHGPFEALTGVHPDLIVLLGTDESRELTLRVLELCVPYSGRLLVYDAADFGPLHPLLTPLVMNPVLQWLIVYSAILRGITDLDERIFMGHGVLSDSGASWP
jgi:fructoselysine 6-phosphate deglycase